MKKKKPFICFIHIERAGGTTLHHIFQNNFPLSYLVLYPRYGKSSKYGYEFSSDQLRKLTKTLPFIKGIGGHTTRAYLNYESAINKKDIYYITFLRDPVKRYISHFNFQLYRKNINWSIEEFTERKEFNNFQTKRIAGEPNLDKAKKILDNKIDFIGITEKFDESLLLLQNEMKYLNVHYRKYNEIKNNQKITIDDFSQKIKEKILNINAKDIELYNFALSKFEEKTNEIVKFNEKLEKFKKTNSEYNPPKLKNTISKIFKGITRYTIEPYISKNTL
ncbi:MAG: sulfotransferase family 2 domain-containing protein [bacterium]